MIVHVVCRDLRPSPAVKSELDKAREHIERHFKRVTRMDWSLEVQAGQSIAACRVLAGPEVYRATAKGRLMSRAVHDATQKLLVQHSRAKQVKKAVRRRVRAPKPEEA